MRSRRSFFNFSTEKIPAQLIFVASLFFCFFKVNAQSPPHNFRFYNSAQGFHFDKVNQIEQDQFGFLWMATNEGLVRYDGHDFATFENRKDAKLLNGKILHMLLSRNGNLWFGTNNGVVAYHQNEGKFHEITIGDTKENYVNSLAEDASGKIWVGSENGLYVVPNESTNALSTHLNKKEHTFVLCRNGNDVWLTTYNTIYHYNANTLSLIDSACYSSEKNRLDNIQTSVVLDHKNTIWVGKYNGEVFKYDTKTKSTQVFDMKRISGNPSALINSIYVEDENNIWVVVDEAGIWHFDYRSNSFTPYITPENTHHILPSYKITSMFVDRERNVWLGMTKNGLALTNGQMNIFSTLDLDKLAKNTIVSAIYQDAKRQLWVGTDGGGLLLFDPRRNFVRTYSHNPNDSHTIGNDAVLAIFEDSKLRLWIGTFRGGLDLMDRKTNSFSHYTNQKDNPNSLPRNDVRKIMEDGEGNLWLAIHGKGVSCFNPEKKTFTNYTSLSNPWTYDAIIGKNGTVWSSSTQGISRKQKEELAFQNFFATPDLNEKLVNDFSSLFEDKYGHLWIGSVHGLHQFEESQKTIIPVKINPILNKASVKAISDDEKGNLFISTNRGLFRYDPQKQSVMHFGKENGLLSEDFILNSVFRSADSVLYFGTSKGICWFKPKEIKENDQLSKPVLTDIKVFGQSIMPWSERPLLGSQASFLDGIELSYDQNHLNLEFACPSFSEGASGIQFQYQLIGLEKSWQNSQQNRHATYPSLPSGEYVFKVRAVSRESEQVHSEEQVLKIIVKPPFWETWWFRIGLVSITLLGIWAYFRFKTKQIQLANKILEERIVERTFEISQKNIKLEEQRAELELANASKDKLFSIIGHDLRSPFSAVLALGEMLQKSHPSSMSSQEKEITGYIVKASKNAYQMLDNLLHWARTQTGRISFHPSKVDMKTFVQAVLDSVSFQAKDKTINLEYISNQTILATIDRDMMETMLRNLLNNAIKFTQPSGVISVQVVPNETGFDLHVKDNGVGMAPEQVQRILSQGKNSSTYGTRGESGTGIGLLVCREFLDFHMGSWEIISTPGLGTEFVLRIPCEYEAWVHEPTPESPLNTSSNTETEPVENLRTGLLENWEIELVRGKKVLIVDDTEEIRKSVVYQLNDIFSLLEAENGLVAYRLAKETIPDLILSDVVMPEMNGLELSRKLKQDLSTSHIPVILLTSQKEELDVIAGLQSGVDDYLLKPFNANILLLKIVKLLVNRENLKKKFILDDSSLLQSMAENSHDQLLLKKVFKVIDANLSEEEFGVEALSNEIGMHRSNLSRKITSLTGSSPQDLIKIRRMKHAAKLLLASGKNISEVAYETGFSDPKYFSRVFKSYFGMLPSEYVNQ